MIIPEKILCQKRKSSGKKGVVLVHNAEATKKEKKQPYLTTYVNDCNLSTPDIVRKRGETTYILFVVDIKLQTLRSRKCEKLSINQ